jgi:putative transposase
MPEHVHLLISEPMLGTISVVLQALKLGVVQRHWPSARAHPPRRAVRFWQRRFYDFNVWSAEKRIEKLRYLHRNPVRRGFVEAPQHWKWSSYRAYAFREQGTVKVNDWSVLQLRKKEAHQFGDQTRIFSASTSESPLLTKTPREMGHPE